MEKFQPDLLHSQTDTKLEMSAHGQAGAPQAVTNYNAYVVYGIPVENQKLALLVKSVLNISGAIFIISVISIIISVLYTNSASSALLAAAGSNNKPVPCIAGVLPGTNTPVDGLPECANDPNSAACTTACVNIFKTSSSLLSSVTLGVAGMSVVCALLIPSCGYSGAKNKSANPLRWFTACNIISAIFSVQAFTGTHDMTNPFTVPTLIVAALLIVVRIVAAYFGCQLLNDINSIAMSDAIARQALNTTVTGVPVAVAVRIPGDGRM